MKLRSLRNIGLADKVLTLCALINFEPVNSICGLFHLTQSITIEHFDNIIMSNNTRVFFKTELVGRLSVNTSDTIDGGEDHSSTSVTDHRNGVFPSY